MTDAPLLEIDFADTWIILSIGSSKILELNSTESTSLLFTYVFLDVIYFLPFLPSLTILEVVSAEFVAKFLVTVLNGISIIVVSIFSSLWFEL